MKIILLIGLPGSGKTTWVKSQDLGPKDLFIDDIKDLSQIYPGKIPADTTMLYIADPHLCNDRTRRKAHDVLELYYPAVEILYVFWKNDLHAAWKNILKRNDGRVISRPWLQSLSLQYNPPLDALIIQQEP